MTILATHFAIVLGAWRLRIRIDIDEPRAADVDDPEYGDARRCNGRSHPAPEFAARGRG